ncbi:UDP-glycosyltransferase 71E1-like [Sesamum indicum]|uniref:Glycosyltransferase n=1 Tax=Sesamum indicum TaxID=4182 RepID=A0A6I9UJB2_SESIN|nr:UDP-glycosyltransferase 71E1-like [Sesamum indicum]
MSGKTKAELVFIPSPGRGHLLATVEMAKLLIDRDERLSITVLVIKPSFDPNSSAHSYSPESNSRIRFIDITNVNSLSMSMSSPLTFLEQFIENHKDPVRNSVTQIVHDFGPNCGLAGFVIDMFCTAMIDVANEFDVPTYMFFTSGASALGLMFHFQGLRDYQNQDVTLYENSSEELCIPSYKLPVPAKLLPALMFDKDGGSTKFLDHAKRFRETKGIVLNTFLELESHAMKSLSEDDNIPPVYSVGPILHSHDENDRNPKYEEIMKWLDEQPDSSVVFLCFGSRGCFDDKNQVKEIAVALENSGHRFLWSLRKPANEHKFRTPGEYDNLEEVLPEGFLERNAGIGKVIGWAPQIAILSHRAVGGFVSHCGWNSTLESMWCGVPMAVWPLSAEQQMNAFQLVKDLGVAVEIKMDYKRNLMGGSNMNVTAEEIENGIRRLMQPQSETWVNVEAMKLKSRMALVENGSSFDFVGRFIENVMHNVA